MADTNQILKLAAIIREVDGDHSKGAAALAESILDHPRFRAVLAGEPTVPQGREPASVADGEVAELVAEIRHFLAGYQQMRGLDPEHIYSIHRGDKMEAHITVSRLTRAAELLERLSPPQPVPVSERPWEREEWCDTNGLCWLGSDALDGCTPTWLYGPPAWAERFPTVHRVVLPAHALPLPEVGE